MAPSDHAADAVSGRSDATRDAYTTALELAERAGLSTIAAAARYRRGELIGGDDRDCALDALRTAGVVDPVRFVSMWAPGARD